MEDINTLASQNKKLQIGDVFTPLKWGEFAIEKFGIFTKWLGGATVLDPTMGEGNLLEALISYGLKQGFPISDLPTNTLFGNELNTNYFNEALRKFKRKYGLDMSKNFTNEDFLKLPPKQYDIILGNPPWQNFNDLPENYKEQIKRYFFRYNLVHNSQDLLLGGSRIDIAALVIKRAIKDFLKHNGEAVMFLPLSLFLNDGAHKNFRTYSIGEVNYCVETIYDLNGENVFEGISTRYGLGHFIRDKKTHFPIPYFRSENGAWKKYNAKPMFYETDPLSILSENEENTFKNIEPIILKKESTPRQGINPCGANDVYIFDKLNKINHHLVSVSNKIRSDIILPKKFVFPLLTSKEFQSDASYPSKWILLPYHTDGSPLHWEQIKEFPELMIYLENNKDILQKRKGIMLKALIARGYWWAMLGVGRYNFFPYKVVWEAYGRTTFTPKIFEGHWQANQSLQAYIPVRTLSEAKRIQIQLSDKKIESYLRSLKMEGTMNWAQPGKIKKIIQYEEEPTGLLGYNELPYKAEGVNTINGHRSISAI